MVQLFSSKQKQSHSFKCFSIKFIWKEDKKMSDSMNILYVKSKT